MERNTILSIALIDPRVCRKGEELEKLDRILADDSEMFSHELITVESL